MKLFGSIVLFTLLTSTLTVNADGCVPAAARNSLAPGSRLTTGPGIKDDTGIKEVIPNNFLQKYKRWKNELLSTEFGSLAGSDIPSEQVVGRRSPKLALRHAIKSVPFGD